MHVHQLDMQMARQDHVDRQGYKLVDDGVREAQRIKGRKSSHLRVALDCIEDHQERRSTRREHRDGIADELATQKTTGNELATPRGASTRLLAEQVLP